ncbi:unnamed protein product [Cyprideis torosa]|uniref:ParB-like N-terminal domain-containing protein n=1 Tax=Cyprideis torosa TaxID=163714 RepID=A0A7R8ZXH7_9CRUS|nr:unnamed protein product [Cyprideis torosa]CAG0906823.1 unnamed protein product [Cyprideis torosa]
MAEDASKRRLGRGLAALIGEMDKPVAAAGSAPEERSVEPIVSDRIVPIENVRANPNNPRRQFADADLEDLANSISEHGIVQPILVRPAPSGSGDWEIIAGERRWRAAQRAGLHQVPIIVREVDDRQALELAIIENVQRADLNPVEEALGYQQLMDEYSYGQADLGKVIGKSRSHVANTLRLLKLPTGVRALLSEGSLSPGHARTLITLERPEALAKRIVDEGLSVRQAEQLAAAAERPEGVSSQAGKGQAPAKDADTKALEKTLSDALGMKVLINHKASGRGRLMIDYKSLDQLDALQTKLQK